jgi:hypothetical protein
VTTTDGDKTWTSDVIVVDQVTSYTRYATVATTVYTNLGRTKLGTFQIENAVNIYGTVGNWCYVYYNGTYGFISKDTKLSITQEKEGDHKGQIKQFRDGKPAENYAGIFDPYAYVNDVYYGGWTLSKKNILNVPNFTQNSIEPNAGNCTIVSITRLFAFYRNTQGKSKIPANNAEVYNEIIKIAIKYGYDDVADARGNKPGNTNPFTINNIIDEAISLFGYRGSGASHYIGNVIYVDFDMMAEIDAGRPFLLSMFSGDYAGHTVTVIGYEQYYKFGVRSKVFLKVWDGWSTKPRYIDYENLLKNTVYSWSTLKLS